MRANKMFNKDRQKIYNLKKKIQKQTFTILGLALIILAVYFASYLKVYATKLENPMQPIGINLSSWEGQDMIYGVSDKQNGKYITDINGHEIYDGETFFTLKKGILCRECFGQYLKRFDEETIALMSGIANINILNIECKE